MIRLFLMVIILAISTVVINYPKMASYNNGLLDVYFFNIGQGDSILIKTPDKKIIMIDVKIFYLFAFCRRWRYYIPKWNTLSRNSYSQ